jgi:hypothetical protein
MAAFHHLAAALRAALRAQGVASPTRASPRPPSRSGSAFTRAPASP